MCLGVSGNTKYYEILGVSKNCSSEDVNKAYDRAALMGGCTVKLLDSYRAYQILRDPEKRQLYDQYGEDAVKDLVGDDVPFYYEYDPPWYIPGVRRSKDLVYPLEVSLQDLCFGTSKKLSISCNVLCYMCNGNGTKSGASMKCLGCQGVGVKVSLRQIRPGMFEDMQDHCYECNGVGEFVNDEDPCPSCMGEKVVRKRKVFEVYVEKGMHIGQRITFPGQADEAPDTVTANVWLDIIT